MAVKKPGQKIYRTMQGKQIDMDLLRKRNELTPAVGNAKVNARGDELGPGGKIIRKREDIVQEYYKNSKPVVQERVTSPQPVAEETTTVTKKATRSTANKVEEKAKLTETEKEMFDDMDEWIEDEDGNFVKK